jgi:hypothetical protein
LAAANTLSSVTIVVGRQSDLARRRAEAGNPKQRQQRRHNNNGDSDNDNGDSNNNWAAFTKQCPFCSAAGPDARRRAAVAGVQQSDSNARANFQ